MGTAGACLFRRRKGGCRSHRYCVNKRVPEEKERVLSAPYWPDAVFDSERVAKSSNRLGDCFKSQCQPEDLALRIMFLSADLRGALKESWNMTMPQLKGGVTYDVPPPDAKVTSK